MLGQAAGEGLGPTVEAVSDGAVNLVPRRGETPAISGWATTRVTARHSSGYTEPRGTSCREAAYLNEAMQRTPRRGAVDLGR
jgi:hypothetical protein